MTITKTFTLEADDDMINNIIEDLQNNCESWAIILLERTNLDFKLDEYKDCRQKLTKEIFDDVVDSLIFVRNEG